MIRTQPIIFITLKASLKNTKPNIALDTASNVLNMLAIEQFNQ